MENSKDDKAPGYLIPLGLLLLFIAVGYLISKKKISEAEESIRADSIASVTAAIRDSIRVVKRDSATLEIKRIVSGLDREVDDMRGIVFYQDKSSPKYLNQNSVFCYLVEKDDAYFVRLKIQYHGNDWLFVRRYIFKADTATFNYRLLDGADSKVGNGGGVMEWIDVEVGASEFEIINALANGSDCKIRYEGQYYKDRIITNKEKAALKKFAAIYPLVQLLQ